jgi:thiosulfate dehydrogenase [quinone] large subunit
MATEDVRTNAFRDELSLSVSAAWAEYWIAFLRLITGWWFFHAGLEKYMAPEPFSAAWFVGQSGTIVSPLMSPFSSGAGLAFVNLMIPLGQVLIGLALMLGVLTRFAAFWGAFLMFFFYFVNQEWAFGFVNGNLMGLLLFVTVVVFGAGRVWGLDGYLERTDTVRNNPWLRYFLG